MRKSLALTGVTFSIVVASLLLATGQSATSTTTPWGDPDLQGIWTDTYDTPLQRPARFAGREFLTEEEVAALDKERSAILRRDHREPQGSERDVSGAYNAVFESVKPTSRRTSLVIEPDDGRIPGYTSEARMRLESYREYQLALMQATETCKKQEPSCRGGKYGPPSPRRAETPPPRRV